MLASCLLSDVSTEPRVYRATCLMSTEPCVPLSKRPQSFLAIELDFPSARRPELWKSECSQMKNPLLFNCALFAGVKGTNAMMLGSGIQILEAALVKADQLGVTTPPFIPDMDIKVKRTTTEM